MNGSIAEFFMEKLNSITRGWWNRVHVGSELRGTLVHAKAIAKAYVHIWTDLGTCMYHNTGPWVIYLYETSTCKYVRLNALNILHIHGPRFNAPHHKCYKGWWEHSQSVKKDRSRRFDVYVWCWYIELYKIHKIEKYRRLWSNPPKNYNWWNLHFDQTIDKIVWRMVLVLLGQSPGMMKNMSSARKL